MKILVIQLARFGDIYQTWPTLKGLKRLYPESEITFLVREKFAAATEGVSSFVKVVTFATAHILAPVLFDAQGESEAAKRLDAFIASPRPIRSDYQSDLLSFQQLLNRHTLKRANVDSRIYAYFRRAP